MYYRIRKDKKDELKNGRTITYLSNLCGCSRVYLSYIFNGYAKRKASKDIIKKIIIGISKDSIRINKRLEDSGIEETIKYFFEEIK